MRKVLVDQEWLKRLHRDLDACQKVIWLGLRGADPAYCQDAQDRLKEIDELLAQPAEAEGVDLKPILEDVEREYEMGGLSDGLYADYASDVAKRYASAALSAVTAERDRLRKDAERYRWLRECDHEKDGGDFGVWTCDYDPLKRYQGAELDEAVDAAMAAKEA